MARAQKNFQAQKWKQSLRAVDRDQATQGEPGSGDAAPLQAGDGAQAPYPRGRERRLLLAVRHDLARRLPALL
eukprot:2939992-Prymnesium_polylepis.1